MAERSTKASISYVVENDEAKSEVRFTDEGGLIISVSKKEEEKQ